MTEPVFPTSFGQQRLWFLDQFAPGTIAYNLPRAFRLTGLVDREALGKAFQVVISRHDPLRTVFTSVDGEPKQVVLPAYEFDLPVVDLSGLPVAQREPAALRIATEEAHKPFDLNTGPLLRVKLLQLDSQQHILVLVMHHITTDGWSMSVLFREIAELYAMLIAGKEPDLPRLPLHYSDFCRWQRASVAGDLFADQLNYWKRKLQGAEVILQLPTDHRRPAVHSGRGRTLHFELSDELTRKLRALAQSEHATLFMVLLALFQILLGRYTAKESILVGIPTAGRNEVELESLVGFFVNTLLIRADLAADRTFRQIVGQVRASTVEALAHQDLPFEKLVEAMEPDRSTNRTPLFQVMFVFHNEPKQRLEIPGLVVQEIEFESGIATFDLTLEILDLDSLHCTFQYDSDLYNDATIQRLAGHFSTIVEGVVGAPNEKISKLPLLTAPEIQQLKEWNNTASDYRRELCVHTAFEEQATLTPDKIVLICGERRLTYRALNEFANRLSRQLISRGIKPGSLVGVSLDRSAEMVVALLAILKTGAAYVPLNPDYPESRLQFMVEDSQADLVVTTPEFSELWGKHGVDTLAFTLATLHAETLQDISKLLPSISAEDRIYVIYTSGSTGRPKGVEGSHRACMNRLAWMWQVYPFRDGETCCQKTSLGFVDSVWEIFGPLLRGVTSVILPDDAVVDPERLVRLLSDYEVTRIVLVPSLLRAILEAVTDLQAALPKLQLWSCSGEVLPADLAKRFGDLLPRAKLLNIYGSAEVAADVTWHEVTSLDRNGTVPIGKPISNVRVHILDCHRRQVPVGVPGELFIEGDCLARGYWRRPELTAERFIIHDFDDGGSVRLFRTGDFGRYLRSGTIEYIGRTDNQVKIRGMRVELEEIETALKLHPSVYDAAVVLAERPRLPKLVAYVVVRPGNDQNTADLRRFLRSMLPEYMVPSDYFVVADLPLLPSGKSDRKSLASNVSAHTAGDSYVAPQNPTQERLARIWRDLLGLDKVGIEDNFFELGGHSLMAMQVMARIRKIFDVDVPLRRLFENPTVEAFANEVDMARAKGIKAHAPISAFLEDSDRRDQLKRQIDDLSDGQV